ncbi:MAG: hypothetical protein PHH85_00920 [Candidatus Methanoperedens sp.]|nr:hypothetical protein [Candidatus Methanoperedens sp.]
MKSSLTIAALLIIIFVLIIPFSVGASEKRSLVITSLTINFEKTDATFTVNYDLGGLSKIFVLLMGSKNLEPRITSMFSEFDYEIVKMDQEKAVLRVKNVSWLDKGYYFHDSIKFGEYIDTVYVYTSDSPRPKEYSHINSTQPTFYRS